MDSGTSVIDCTSCDRVAQDRRLVGERDAGVDVEHVRAGRDLRERVGDHRLKSPFFISSASSLRPVGLMRSPIITKGRSNPITTSLVARAR